MKARHLLKLAKICSKLEKSGQPEHSDMLRVAIVKLGANWQSPYVDIPMLERVWPFSIVEEDFKDADFNRFYFPRYREKDDLELSGDDDELEFNSLEVSLHPEESDPGAGVKFVWYDGASSLQQGHDWGKKIEKHDENNASGMRYKNLVPTFY